MGIEGVDTMGAHTIDGDKLEAIVMYVQRVRPSITADDIEAFITADWSEGDEHQEWIDRAPVTEIAIWAMHGMR